MWNVTRITRGRLLKQSAKTRNETGQFLVFRDSSLDGLQGLCRGSSDFTRATGEGQHFGRDGFDGLEDAVFKWRGCAEFDAFRHAFGNSLTSVLDGAGRLLGYLADGFSEAHGISDRHNGGSACARNACTGDGRWAGWNLNAGRWRGGGEFRRACLFGNQIDADANRSDDEDFTHSRGFLEDDEGDDGGEREADGVLVRLDPVEHLCHGSIG